MLLIFLLLFIFRGLQSVFLNQQAVSQPTNHRYDNFAEDPSTRKQSNDEEHKRNNNNRKVVLFQLTWGKNLSW